MVDRVIRRRIRRGDWWGELAADVNVVIGTNVGGHGTYADEASRQQPQQGSSDLGVAKPDDDGMKERRTDERAE